MRNLKKRKRKKDGEHLAETTTMRTPSKQRSMPWKRKKKHVVCNRKKLQKMSEADFGFDENEWLDTTNQDEDGDVVTEVLKDVEITTEMGSEERLRILQTRYPEFEFLANDFLFLQPVLVGLQTQIEDENAGRETMVKCRTLAAYIAALSMYFALLTSPSRNFDEHKTLDPAELRDHPIMDSLLQCRSLWMKVQKLNTAIPDALEIVISEEGEPIVDLDDEVSDTNGFDNGSRKKDKESAASSRASRLAAASIDDLSTLLRSSKHRKASKPTTNSIAAFDSGDSDFGEADTLSSKAAGEKAAKKKSLRFYTSQITQKSNKRAGAGRDAGGDEDLPYRERFRDRQARLNAEAETRGKKLDLYGRGGVALGDGSDEEGQDKMAEQLRGDEDEYYNVVAQTSKKRKMEKAATAEMMKEAKAAGGLLRVMEEDHGDGKRAIGYSIQKNKGLAPKRKKEVRNPRVKKRMKYEEKKKKLASTRAVYRGGEERGGYGGEKTGIKTGLVKSVKL